jgi:hypothetical protein
MDKTVQKNSFFQGLTRRKDGGSLAAHNTGTVPRMRGDFGKERLECV